jgi:uncharacterized protein (TIGR02117 family)
VKPTKEKSHQPRSWARIFTRLVKAFFLFWIGYATIVLVGLIPVNNQFRPSDQGVRIYLISSAIHADIIVPIVSEQKDWKSHFATKTFRSDLSNQTHVAFGWGDKGFYLETETWSDFKLTTAANALFLPSASCMHVTFTRPEYMANKVAVTISPEEYQKLVSFIEGSFVSDDANGFLQIGGYAYSYTDAFFEAHGRYHLLNTCNSWVGRALKHAGVRVPFLSPLPGTPMLYLNSE